MNTPRGLVVLIAMMAPGLFAQKAEAGRKVLVLAPTFEYKDYKTDATLQGQDYGAEAYSAAVGEFGRNELQARKVEIVLPDTLKGEEWADALGRLRAHSSKLARGVVTEPVRYALARAAILDQGELWICAQHFEVKIGPHGKWTPGHGVFTPQMTTLLVRAALISSRTDEVPWKGQSFVRDYPAAGKEKFNSLLRALYSTLSITVRQQ